MKKEYHYPVQYAVLELKKETNWLHGYQPLTEGFIVAKCYVVGSYIKYHANGSQQISHQVVFPFENILLFETGLLNGEQNIGEKVYPSYDAANNPYPIHEVSDLFTSYEEAKILANQYNEEYRRKLSLGIAIDDPNWQERYDLLKQGFDQKLKICELFEQEVLKATDDMEICQTSFYNNQENVLRILKP